MVDLDAIIKLHVAGKVEEAAEGYALQLETSDPSPIAANNLAIILQKRARHDRAIQLFSQAIHLKPDYPEAYCNRANSFVALSRNLEAENDFKSALAYRPSYINAMRNYGALLAHSERYEEAYRLFSNAFELNTKDSGLLNNLLNVCLALENFRQAEEIVERVGGPESLTTFDLQMVWVSLLSELSGNQAAKEYLNTVVAHSDIEESRVMIAQATLSDDPDEKIECFKSALMITPTAIDALINLGICYLERKRFDLADKYLTQAMAQSTENAVAFLNLGVLRRKQGRKIEAIELFTRALRIEPQYSQALRNLGLISLGEGDPKIAADAFMKLIEKGEPETGNLGFLALAKQSICDWNDIKPLKDRLLNSIQEDMDVVDPFSLLAISGDAGVQKMAAIRSNSSEYPQTSDPLWAGEEYSHDRIRIAYLSADYHEHATSYLMAELFESHDKSQFETYAISFGKHSDGAMRQRLVKAFDHFIDVNDKTDREAAELMRELEIDIAIDLKGYTADARPGILSHRPCPVQAQYLGFPGTMGAPYIDYIIADDVIIPESHEQYYTEKVIRLPGCYQPCDSKQKIADRIPTRAEEGLPDDAYVYCCFNNNYKITPEIFDVWMEILKDVPDSVLWLYEGNAAAPPNLRKEAEKRGVDPSRLVFAKKKPIEEHLARHQLADLFLDTIPCNAHTTARDALIAGLPVLTIMGDTFASRVAASIGQTVLSGLVVATDFNEYQQIAIQRSLAPVGFKTYDPAGYTLDLESVYLRLMA